MTWKMALFGIEVNCRHFPKTCPNIFIGMKIIKLYLPAQIYIGDYFCMDYIINSNRQMSNLRLGRPNDNRLQKSIHYHSAIGWNNVLLHIGIPIRSDSYNNKIIDILINIIPNQYTENCYFTPWFPKHIIDNE